MKRVAFFIFIICLKTAAMAQARDCRRVFNSADRSSKMTFEQHLALIKKNWNIRISSYSVESAKHVIHLKQALSFQAQLHNQSQSGQLNIENSIAKVPTLSTVSAQKFLLEIENSGAEISSATLIQLRNSVQLLKAIFFPFSVWSTAQIEELTFAALALPWQSKTSLQAALASVTWIKEHVSLSFRLTLTEAVSLYKSAQRENWPLEKLPLIFEQARLEYITAHPPESPINPDGFTHETVVLLESISPDNR